MLSSGTTGVCHPVRIIVGLGTDVVASVLKQSELEQSVSVMLKTRWAL